jgi:hypothetical protein
MENIMPVELQDAAWIIGGLGVWAVIDFSIVKYQAWRASKKPAPRGAVSI